MWRPAVLILCTLVACWRGTTDRAIDNHARGGERDLTAAYLCSIDDGYKYPSFPCVIRKVEGRWMLAKLGGSQRFRGVITPNGEGFTFDGQLYCPWGDCTSALHGELKPIGRGALRGMFREVDMVVTLVPAPDSAFGGAAYGGDGYGGFGYGGLGYGGALQHRGNRRP